MTFAPVGHVGMNLVGYHDYPFALAYDGEARELFPAPDLAGRIVGIGKDEESPSGELLQGLIIHMIPALTIFNQRHVDDFPPVGFGSDSERVVDRGHYIHLIAGSGEEIHHHTYTLDDARDIANPFRLYLPSVKTLLPFDYRGTVIVRLAGVAQHRMIEPPSQCIDNEGRSGEIHVRHPCGYYVVAAEHLLESVGLYRASFAALNDLIEIIHAHGVGLTIRHRIFYKVNSFGGN